MFGRHSFSRAVVISLSITALPYALAVRTRAEYISRALNGTDVLNEAWLGDDGLWQDLDGHAPIWWNSANILTTLGNLAQVSPDFHSTFAGVAARAFVGGLGANTNSWLNDFYDDEGWWALAWIKAYDITNNAFYLAAAQFIYEDLRTGLHGSCGGIWWSKDKTAIASIANELFIATGAALASRVPGHKDFYLAPTTAQIDWLLAPTTGLLNENNTLFDGLDIASCQPSGFSQNVFSYNQGVLLGGLVDVAALTGNATYLQTAASIAHGTLAHLADPYGGILTDPGYPNSEDMTGAQFKGVFARNLMYLHAAAPDDAYARFLQTNADSIWEKARSLDGKFGGLWQGPVAGLNAAAQGSALDALIAAAAVSG